MHEEEEDVLDMLMAWLREMTPFGPGAEAVNKVV